jgi:hypothetical protein
MPPGRQRGGVRVSPAEDTGVTGVKENCGTGLDRLLGIGGSTGSGRHGASPFSERR